MQQVSQKKLRILYADILLAGFMLLFLPCAKGDLLLFATADDCAAAPVSPRLFQPGRLTRRMR